MLSRVADSAYWLSRYLERAEHTARVAEVCLGLTLDRSSSLVQRLMSSLAAPPAGYGFSSDQNGAASDDRTFMQARDAAVACIAAARENARQVLEQISSEMWEQLNRLYLYAAPAAQQPASATGQLLDFYRYVKEASHLFQGVTDSTMTQNEGWNFIQIGRYLERASTTAGMLDAHFGGTQVRAASGAYIEWAGLLRSCSAFEAYCRCYTADIRPEWVAEFLLLNAQFPRSIRFAVDRVEASLREIARNVRGTPARVDRLAGRLRASLDYGQIEEIMAGDLGEYVQGIRAQCQNVHTALYQTYISYALESAIA